MNAYSPAIVALEREACSLEAQARALRDAIAVLVEAGEEDLEPSSEIGSVSEAPGCRHGAEGDISAAGGPLPQADAIDAEVVSVQCAQAIERINARAERAREDADALPVEDVKPKRRAVDNSARDREIAAAYEAGEASKSIGEWYEITPSRVVQIARAHGVPIRPRGGDFGGRKKKGGSHEDTPDRGPQVNAQSGGDAPQAAAPPSPLPQPQPSIRRQAQEARKQPSPEAEPLRGFVPLSEPGSLPPAQQVEKGWWPGTAPQPEPAEIAIEDSADEIDDDVTAEFEAALTRVRAKRVAAPKPKPDWSRTARAYQRVSKARAAPPERKPPTEIAPSREACEHCGIPGWKGCDHWLPCEDGPPVRVDRDAAPVVDRRRFTGPRQGKSVLRI